MKKCENYCIWCDTKTNETMYFCAADCKAKYDDFVEKQNRILSVKSNSGHKRKQDWLAPSGFERKCGAMGES